MDKLTRWHVWSLVILAVATRLLFLSWPDQVIFDEVHFGKFVTAYCCTGENFFDIHPPHVKLLIAAVGWLGGYRGGFSFENIGQAYGTVPIFWLRLVPALAGALLPLLVYGLLRQLGAGKHLSFLGAWLVLFDNAFVVQSRLISLDMVLLVSTLGSVSAFLKAGKSKGKNTWWWFALSGGLAGLAVGSKFTGLSAPALLGVLGIASLWQARKDNDTIRKLVTGGSVAVVVALVVYALGWAVHFLLLPLPGSGDAFMKTDFSGKTLPVAFVEQTTKLHKVMLSANYNLTATHPYASEWWSWPLMKRPVFYWQGTQAFVYFLGNPLVWWGGSLLLTVSVIASFVMFGQNKIAAVRGREAVPLIWVPLAGFLISMLPLVRVPRALFLYHYLTPLLFALMVGMLWIKRVIPLRLEKDQRQQYIFIAVLAATVVLFIVFSPLTYGLTVSTEWRDSLFWLKTWR